MDLIATAEELAAVRAALAIEDVTQKTLVREAERNAHQSGGTGPALVVVEVSSKAKRVDPYHPSGEYAKHDLLNAALAEVAREKFRDLLDLAGDRLRTRERQLTEQLMVEAAKTAMGKA